MFIVKLEVSVLSNIKSRLPLMYDYRSMTIIIVLLKSNSAIEIYIIPQRFLQM